MYYNPFNQHPSGLFHQFVTRTADLALDAMEPGEECTWEVMEQLVLMHWLADALPAGTA